MKFKKLISLTAAASMLSGMAAALPASAEDSSPMSIYGGSGGIEVISDPTGADKGNIFYLNGFDTNRGNDIVKGRNPYIDIPSSYLYDYENGKYTMKDEWTVAFDWYGMSQGFRYAFYTGTTDRFGNGITGIYFFPDSGASSVTEGLVNDEKKFTKDGEYASIKKEWHNFKLEWKNNTMTVYKDGAVYIETEGGGYAYSDVKEPITRIGYTPYQTDPGAFAYVDNIVITALGEELLKDTADAEYAEIGDVPPEPEQLTVYKDISDGSETQRLIDSRPDVQRRMENLDRGLVAASTEAYGFISWRWLGTESADTMYNLYKNGEKLNAEPLNTTNYIDCDASAGDKYSVAPVINGEEGIRCDEAALLNNDYIGIKLDVPKGGTVILPDGQEQTYSYNANDCSAADLDGDGEFEIILKWDPTNSRDSSHLGATGSTIFDAYKLDGTKLWRIDLGINVRSGAHDTQFLCADFNNDGKGEVAMRTADGTVAGDGTVIGDGTKDWRDINGKNLSGPLYLTLFDGETGAVIDTTDYYPQSVGERNGVKWDINSWGDNWGNRSERYNACVFYEDGKTPSMMFARGYYAKTVLAAYSVRDNKIVNDWIFDTDFLDADEAKKYIGKGNHSLCVADVDYDGKDEIIFGSETFDDNGTPLYTDNELYHGDAQHMGDLVPDRPGLEIFTVHEGGTYGHEMKDARTGEILWSSPKTALDVGRGGCDDIDPTHAGAESWSSIGLLIAADGELITDNYSIPANFLAWWDGDTGREVLDGINISKYNPYTYKVEDIFSATECHSNNAAKSNPSLAADIIGDWREEVVYPTLDNSELRIYTTTIPTGYRIPTLMSDNQYRNSAAVQNVGYNQPTHVDYCLGYDTKSIPVPQIYVVDEDGNEIRNPDLAKKEWNISDLYTGAVVELAIGYPKALIDGAPYYIDGDNTLAPYIDNDRTMVPIRFISEAFGAYVTWDEQTRAVKIQSPDADIIMTIGSEDYTVNGAAKTMDAAPEIKSDRTFIPLRMAAEALNKKVEWNDNGVIVISDVEATTDADAILETIKTSRALQPKGDKAYVNGEKMTGTQAGVTQVYTDTGDGRAACDLNYDTSWKSDGRGIIMMRTDKNPISAVIIKFADGKEHPFRIYTRYDIPEEDQKDPSNRDGWQNVIEATSDGSDDAQTFIFSVPKYVDSIKLELLDNEPCEITEMSAIGVQ
ncbi:MAG: stalk domain-containing protein [Candidatus Ornithomonoglobus sp.]